jgi:hypothetical protein
MGAAFLFLCACALWAEESAAQTKIPLLLSDHHADHAVWLLEQLRRAEGESVSLVVVDAHADTAANSGGDRIRDAVRRGRFREADDLFHNHDWIEPLAPRPVSSLVWISGVSGFPGNDRYGGFVRSTAGWDIPRRCVTLDEIGAASGGDDAGGVLFVSVDLDFFYGRHTAGDIPFALDALLDFSLRRGGKVLWAFCVSRAWLPSAEYAWELLEESLVWLSSRTEFAAPELTLFSVRRRDTSRRAEFFRSMGTEMPGLFQKEDEAPERIRRLLAALAAGGRDTGKD